MSEVDKSGATPSSTELTIDKPEPFIAWLEALPPEMKFGRGTCECPLAKFSGCQVGWVSYDKGHLPDWACVFVERFLKRRGPKNARRALKVMEALS